MSWCARVALPAASQVLVSVDSAPAPLPGFQLPDPSAAAMMGGYSAQQLAMLQQQQQQQLFQQQLVLQQQQQLLLHQQYVCLDGPWACDGGWEVGGGVWEDVRRWRWVAGEVGRWRDGGWQGERLGRVRGEGRDGREV